MKRTSIVIAAAVAALAVGGTAADAAVKKGRFAGKTSEKDPLGFKVTKSHKVYRFYVEGVTLHCSDGSAIDTPTGSDRFELPLRFSISKSRRFSFSVSNDSGTEMKGKGRFNKKGRKASGTLRITAHFDSQTQQEDPEGDVTCRSHKLKWSAKRRAH